jgi:glycosyltransferase involved in cell wall biosynthesis
LPRVSVVIPAYNAAALIGETLDSVLDQSYPDVEVVVVDDGSKDETGRVVLGYGDRVRYFRKENGGIATARNFGHGVATGEYVAWLDADDRCHRDRIACQAAVLMAHPEVPLVSSDFSAFDAAGPIEASHISSYYTTIGRFDGGLDGIYPQSSPFPAEALQALGVAVESLPPVRRGLVRDRLLWGNFIHPPTVMIRRGAIGRAGKLDENLHAGEDYEYFLRLASLGPLAYIPLPLLEYRRSPNQDSANYRKVMATKIRIRERILAREPAFVTANPSFRREIGRSHAYMGLFDADGDRRKALESLGASLRHGYVGWIQPLALLKMATPSFLLSMKRRLLG